MAERGTLVSIAGDRLERRLWPAKGEARGVVQLVHGMAEHIDRYEDTALALNEAGYAVVGHNHLGHGEGAPVKGFFAGENGWDALIADVHALRAQTQARFSGLPYFLLGHSMGSFVVRTYCLRHEKGLRGVVLSGTGHFNKPLLMAAGGVAALLCALGMTQKPSRLLQTMSSAGYLKRYADVQTPFDWLTRDREQVRRYMADPLCGFPFTAGGYRDMFSGLRRLYPENLGAMDKDVPVFLFSGSMDPVGGYGAGVERVAQEIRQAGVKDVTVTLYPDGRHEMFNEINREEAWQGLIGWLNARL